MSTTAPRFVAFDAPLRIGGVALAVRNLSLLTDYYRETLGLDVVDATGERAVLASDGEAILTLVHAPDAPNDRRAEPGLFHTAFVVPSRPHLAAWLARAADGGLRLSGASDHKVSEALYFSDPEGNGIEVYTDRPPATWQRAGEQYVMTTDRLDLSGLLAEAAGATGAPIPIRVGHIHLRGGDLAAASSFYRSKLELALTHERPGAQWYGAGTYHHHVAVNTWSSSGAARRSTGQLGLLGYELVARDPEAFARTAVRIGAAGTPRGETLVFEDPSGIPVTLRARPAAC
jgi:catechol 2,3-dioxygenase